MCVSLGWCKVYFEERKLVWSTYDLYILEDKVVYAHYMWLVVHNSVVEISSPVMS